MYSRKSTGVITFSYFLSDHQGSVADITNSSGTVDVQESFTPFGNRRNPTTWTGAASNLDLTTAASISREGYTFQTQLGLWMGMNHMNGRVQDAITGRFLSADLRGIIPTNAQSFNRYSYALNNPLTLTDPSGFTTCDETCRGILVDIAIDALSGGAAVICLPCGVVLIIGGNLLEGGALALQGTTLLGPPREPPPPPPPPPSTPSPPASSAPTTPLTSDNPGDGGTLDGDAGTSGSNVTVADNMSLPDSPGNGTFAPTNADQTANPAVTSNQAASAAVTSNQTTAPAVTPQPGELGFAQGSTIDFGDLMFFDGGSFGYNRNALPPMPAVAPNGQMWGSTRIVPVN
jgi:RHS repeat-associated protein